jgi:hypothetical protein
MLEIADLEEIDLAKNHDHSSRTHPDLPNKPGGPDNWVEKVGGLPSYIKRVAKHIFYDSPGMTVQHAIAAAVQQIKKWAAQGKPGAIKALAEWTAKKGAAHTLGYSEEELSCYDLAILQQKRGTKYSTLGNAPSAINTGVKGASYDEAKHPRASGGKFGQKLNPSDLIAARRRIEGNLANLQVGQTFKLPGDVGWVKRDAVGYFVQGNGGFTASVRTLSEAIVASATLLAKKGFKG